MKPCRNFRKSIALHAADALDPGEAEALRQHLAQCPACREYSRAMQAVCADHRQAALTFAQSDPLPESPLLHRVSAQLAPGETPSPSIRSTSPTWLQLPRLALPLAALAVAGLFWRQTDSNKTTEPGPTPHPTIAAEHNLPASTHMTYRLALNHSFEQLDRALAKSADDTAPPPAQSLYRSRLELADSGF